MPGRLRGLRQTLGTPMPVLALKGDAGERQRQRPGEQGLVPSGRAFPSIGGLGAERVGSSFIALYALAYTGTILLFLAPLLVSLSLKINALVGADRAPTSLSLVAGTGAFLAIFANPFFGKMSDRTTWRWGMRRPWMVIGLLGGSAGMLVVALAQDIRGVLFGWYFA
jgi:hypothetical protein